jgi:Flp pilus assembly protein CpaB
MRKSLTPRTRYLLLAGVAAVLTGLLVFFYLGTLARRAPVLVAARDFPAYTVLDEDTLRIVWLPAGAIHPLALRQEAEATGRVSLVPRAADEQILTSSLVSGENPGQYRAVLGPEERAFYVPAAGILGGWAGVEKGDYVDLVAVLEGQAATVAQGVEVLEVMREAIAGPIGGRLSESATGVFLRVSPGLAEKVALAVECGRVYCSVFGYSGVPVSTEGVWLEQLYKGGDPDAEALWP